MSCHWWCRRRRTREMRFQIRLYACSFPCSKDVWWASDYQTRMQVTATFLFDGQIAIISRQWTINQLLTPFSILMKTYLASEHFFQYSRKEGKITMPDYKQRQLILMISSIFSPNGVSWCISIAPHSGCIRRYQVVGLIKMRSKFCILRDVWSFGAKGMFQYSIP